ncbi:membrane bound O-acyl transferase family-domain-containing protein [Roridomyces roridus]|uniref:Membrane bound O-acyl transferase family-domain-containing protein n=1 Tax=Roridomyces roridus TaxID=1738132 RepID=A0AAD7CJA2_9AGAR|nr:membrane bound O-acyl transferase family-domain-containing protein [Roridomyces roridus]
MFTVFARSLYRTFGSQPRRNTSQQPETYKRLALDAADLTFGLRGLGWNFAADAKVPAFTTRPLHPYIRLGFFDSWDFLQYFCQCFDWEGLGSPNGGSIYDMSLTPPLRYLRSTTITFFNGLIIYGSIQIGHDLFALIAVLVLRVSSPADWPPIFDSPWLATSLTELWAARWHQIFRQEFVALGGWPLGLVAGRVGAVLGVFSVSGILHFVGLWGMGMADLRVYCFFLMMGVCVVLEGMWKKMTGRRVGGWPGRIWAWTQILFWAHLYIEPWCLSGIMASVFVPTAIRPSVTLHRLIVDILHG